MENFTLDTHIHTLLFKHNCVVIPGFGGFISNYKPAYYNAAKEVYFPPSRSLSFNKNLINNDGLLSQKIAEKYGISFEKANELIVEAVVEYNHYLNTNNRLKLNKIGLLYFDNQQKIQFIPDANENYQLDSFGLNPLFAPVIEEIKTAFNQEEKENATEKETPNLTLEPLLNSKPKVVKLPNSYLKKVTAIAASLIVAFGSIFWLNQNAAKLSKVDLSSLLPSESLFSTEYDDDFKYVVAEKIEGKEFKFLKENSLSTALKQNKEKAFRFNFSSGKVDFRSGIWVGHKKENSESKKGYYLVAGCFQGIENAHKLVNKLKTSGFENAQIFDFENGLHRVSFGNSFEDYQSAKKALLKLQQSNSSVWLAKK